jgi:hypothetical protein
MINVFKTNRNDSKKSEEENSLNMEDTMKRNFVINLSYLEPSVNLLGQKRVDSRISSATSESFERIKGLY